MPNGVRQSAFAASSCRARLGRRRAGRIQPPRIAVQHRANLPAPIATVLRHGCRIPMFGVRRKGALMSAPRPALLCILDGWGWRPDTADNAIAAAQHAQLHAAAGGMPACAAGDLGPRGGPAQGPDGQFRSRPHEYRRRPRGGPGSAAHRCRDRRRHRWRARPALLRPDRQGARQPKARCI